MTILHAIIPPPRHSYTTAVTKSVRMVSYRSHSSTTPHTSSSSVSSTTHSHSHAHIHNPSNKDGSHMAAAAERAYLKKHQHLRPYSSLNCNTPYNLCFLRHGQSTWNRDNRFIGWTDTPLTEDGVLEARVAGQMLSKSGVMFDEVHTSLLRRSIRTTNLALMELGQEYIPVLKHWRLNERNYGDLVGRNKKEVVEKYGGEKVKSWRRGWDDPPPDMDEDHPYWPGKDPRYKDMLERIPAAESLKMTMERSGKYWDDVIAPRLREGKTLLIVGHENNLRSMIKRLEDIDDDQIIGLSLPRAVPLAYKLDSNLKPIMPSSGQLDRATGFLRGEWLGGDDAVHKILDRDHKQVYDCSVKENLEKGAKWESWRNWMEFAIGKDSPDSAAKSAHSNYADGGMRGSPRGAPR